ncbi:hypothetical protein SAICODRAFT_9453 [Saitoella complicata NRRL Y-17804]|uniref:Protein EFR3 n=1 Tax=Saitoella complicata (strain BCRC 22490 / CBS 7301 / JCM 7358 / NBRC 10748 / NRRL Y-17804) TaxID=698492 RepID=A0A0E9NEY5_SAICN|nr:uncharacterized protein SAICODRAFT_9453 [Saitoella complicata NRRL Y-17804]ODQ50801.1 hypothetical protein SAICODRAFT_9453 [Saitoella complicata NRRL Y-17804]GAO48286.1 hypothetical protein G7K_2464-t1 [Saitoella complicata NRRL Y-17804]
MPNICVPKHQRLIRNCYPKGKAPEKHPNSSELSYLCYYASTRPSKLQKVGKYLEKKVAKDVYYRRTGDVIVSLDICRALILKCTNDLNLFASYILSILHPVITSGDPGLIAHSLPCFTTFVTHLDASIVAMDPEFARKADEVVKLYTACAVRGEGPTRVGSGRPGTSGSGNISSAAQAAQWREIGLTAIKGVCESSTLFAVRTQFLLAQVVPGILANLPATAEDDEEGEPTYLRKLNERVNNPRSPSTIAPPTLASAAPVTPGGQPLARHSSSYSQRRSMTLEDPNEPTATLALQALHTIFDRASAPQVRLATDALLQTPTYGLLYQTDRNGQGTEELLDMCARWTPVEIRFLILSELLEILVQKREMAHKERVVKLMAALLGSEVNLVGLAVLDVLTTLLEEIIAHVRSHPQDTKGKDPVLAGYVSCIGGLARHIYYSEQIVDMCGAILLRLQPTIPEIVVDSPLATGSDIPEAHLEQSNIQLPGLQTMKYVGLKCLKEILVAANKAKIGVAVERRRVGLGAWKRSLGLIGDEKGEVRVGYVDALWTWLEVEYSPSHSSTGIVVGPGAAAGVAEFVGAVHSAAYALLTRELGVDERDVAAVYALMTKLLERFGDAAAKDGINMVLALQEERTVTAPVHSLIGGYLEYAAAKLGLEGLMGWLHTEIREREGRGEWCGLITSTPVPPAALSGTPMSQSATLAVAKPVPYQRDTVVAYLPEWLRDAMNVPWAPKTYEDSFSISESGSIRSLSRSRAGSVTPSVSAQPPTTGRSEQGSPSRSVNEARRVNGAGGDRNSTSLKVDDLRRLLLTKPVENAKQNRRVVSQNFLGLDEEKRGRESEIPRPATANGLGLEEKPSMTRLTSYDVDRLLDDLDIGDKGGVVGTNAGVVKPPYA